MTKCRPSVLANVAPPVGLVVGLVVVVVVAVVVDVADVLLVSAPVSTISY
jgi:hypothetical protein